MTDLDGRVERPTSGPPLAELGTRTAVAWLLALVAARAAVYLGFGAEFVGDDRGFMARRVLFGATAAGSDFRSGRPVAGVVYDAVFGVSGQHPVVLFGLVTLLNAVAVVLLYLVLRRFVANGLAFLATGAWVLMATHTSLVVWGATAPAVVGLIAALLGIMAADDRRWLLATGAFVVAVASYELFGPVALAALGLAALRDRGDRAERRQIAAALVAVALATAWCAAQTPVPADWRIPNPALLWTGHFGRALFGGKDMPGRVELLLEAAVAVGAVAASVAWVRGERGRDDGPSLVLAGFFVFGTGALVSLTVPVQRFGTSDRLYAVSSIGAAMIIVGIAVWCWRRWRVPATAVGVGLAVVFGFGMVISLATWSQAGQDGAAILDAMGHRSVRPQDVHWVIGPTRPERRGVIVMQTWDGDLAFRVRYRGGSGSVRVVGYGEDYVVAREEVGLDWQTVVPADRG